MELPYTSVVKRIARRLTAQRIVAANRNTPGSWIILNEDHSVARHLDGVEGLEAYARALGVLGEAENIAPISTGPREPDVEAQELAVIVSNLTDDLEPGSRAEILELLSRVAPRTRPTVRRLQAA